MPVIGLGASAALYYPAVASLLRVQGFVPADADVANAIGAVVGRVRVHADVYVSQPERGRFRVHHPDSSSDVNTMAEALDAAESIARSEALANATQAGADAAEVSVSHLLNIAHVEGEELFVDGTVTAVASGRPAVAR